MTILLDTRNSSDTPLGVAEVFTGVPACTCGHSSVRVYARPDQSGTLTVEFGEDAVHWDVGVSLSCTAAQLLKYETPVRGRYVRLTYTNGGTGHDRFYLDSMLQ